MTDYYSAYNDVHNYIKGLDQAKDNLEDIKAKAKERVIDNPNFFYLKLILEVFL